MIALVDLAGEVLRVFSGGPEVAVRVNLPDGSQISPIILGWTDGRFAVLEVEPFTVPEGKRITGSASYAIDGDTVLETYEVEDITVPGPADYQPSAVRMIHNVGSNSSWSQKSSSSCGGLSLMDGLRPGAG